MDTPQPRDGISFTSQEVSEHQGWEFVDCTRIQDAEPKYWLVQRKRDGAHQAPEFIRDEFS